MTARRRGLRREPDVHELLKREMFAPGVPACSDHYEKSRPCPASVHGVSDQYVVLDSFAKSKGSKVERGEFSFNFMVQGVTRDQIIGVKETLDTIIEAEVYAFSIPHLPFDEFNPTTIHLMTPGLPAGALTLNAALPTDGAFVTNAQSQFPFSKRVTMYLREIGLQSFSDPDDRRHHFEFEAADMSEVVCCSGTPPDKGRVEDHIALTPLRNGERFVFTNPIKDIHGLTVCFYNPTNPLRFPPDVLYGATAATNAATLLEFTYVDQTNLINLAVDDRIFIDGFVTGDQMLDTYVGRPEGHLIGAGGFTLTPPAAPRDGTTVTFRLNPDIDLSVFVGFVANSPVVSTEQINIKIAKNRVRIPIRFRRVVDRLTNYIAP